MKSKLLSLGIGIFLFLNQSILAEELAPKSNKHILSLGYLHTNFNPNDKYLKSTTNGAIANYSYLIALKDSGFLGIGVDWSYSSGYNDHFNNKYVLFIPQISYFHSSAVYGDYGFSLGYEVQWWRNFFKQTKSLTHSDILLGLMFGPSYHYYLSKDEGVFVGASWGVHLLEFKTADLYHSIIIKLGLEL